MFTATLLFQPQLIRTLYIQLQMIKHIIRHFLVLNTCTQTLFHTRHIREMQEIFRRAHNNKRQYFIESFSDKKCELQTWTCLKVVFVLFHRFTHLLALGTPLGVLIVWNPYRITPIHWLMARMPAPTFSCRILCMRMRHLFLHEAAMLALVAILLTRFWSNFLGLPLHLHFGDCSSGTLFSSRFSSRPATVRSFYHERRPAQ